ncbi:helix-turn-helix domain-containing protein [Leuconostoc citreum]
MPSTYKRIDFEERLQIKNFIDAGLSNSEIARRLHRSRAAITLELQRNARVVLWRGKKLFLGTRTNHIRLKKSSSICSNQA